MSDRGGEAEAARTILIAPGGFDKHQCTIEGVGGIDKADTCTVVEAGSSVRETVDRIVQAVVEEGVDPSVLCVDLHLDCGRYERRDIMGLAIIKALRMRRGVPEQVRGAHCLVFGFLPLITVHRLAVRNETSAFILSAPGHTYVRLPADLTAIATHELAETKAPLEPQALAPYIRGGVRLPDERHSWANWFSAWQMLRIYETETEDPEISAEQFLLPSMGEDIQDALFLYGAPGGYERELRGGTDRLKEKRQRIRSLTKDRRPSLIDDQAEAIEGRTKVGWQEVFSRVLLGRGEGIVDVLHETGASERGLDSDHPARVEIQEYDFSDHACLLLDLRLLREERGPLTHPEELSGAKILGQIRESWPTLPIIITTASNKARSFEDLMRLGADAYWIKLGPDEGEETGGFIESYERLLDLVYRAVGPRYQFSYRLGRALDELEHSERGYWWDEAGWFEGEVRGAWMDRNNRIRDMTRDILFLLRTHLHRYEMGYGYKGTEDAARLGYEDASGERLSMLAVVQHGGKIIEAIHGFDQLEQGQDRSRATVAGTWNWETRKWEVNPDQHGDWIGFYLLGVRNRASHYGDYEEIDWEALQRFLTHLCCYLLFGPQATFRPPGYSMANENIEASMRRFLEESDSEYTRKAEWLRG